MRQLCRVWFYAAKLHHRFCNPVAFSAGLIRDRQTASRTGSTVSPVIRKRIVSFKVTALCDELLRIGENRARCFEDFTARV